MRFLSRLMSSKGKGSNAARTRCRFDEMPRLLYVIGDVHGCFDLMTRLETTITLDAQRHGGVGCLIYLGDLIDRGPASASVVDHMLNTDLGGLQRIVLCGNHEDMFLRF